MEQKVIAISCEERNQWGCPYCGFRSSYCHVSGCGAAIMKCAECQQNYVVLTEGIQKSPYGVGVIGQEDIVYPELQDHPRRGVTAHGNPDKQPENGGEFFNSRGIGVDMTPGCFVCGCRGGRIKPMSNIAAFVQCREAGERVVAMFRRGAWLDYREREPDRVQVKIGACKRHEKMLAKLDLSTSDGIITEEKIAKVIGKRCYVLSFDLADLFNESEFTICHAFWMMRSWPRSAGLAIACVQGYRNLSKVDPGIVSGKARGIICEFLESCRPSEGSNVPTGEVAIKAFGLLLDRLCNLEPEYLVNIPKTVVRFVNPEIFNKLVEIAPQLA